MPADKLAKALESVDWKENVGAFLADTAAAEQLAQSSFRLAVWAKQLEIADQANPALSFIREMQVSVHHVAATVAL